MYFSLASLHRTTRNAVSGIARIMPMIPFKSRPPEEDGHDDGQRMETCAVTHDPWGEDVALDELHDREDDQTHRRRV